MERSALLPILGAAGALALVVGFYTLVQRNASRLAEIKPALTEEQKTYLPDIVVSDARVSAARNLVGDRVVYLDARVTNRGRRTVGRLDLELEFHDVLSQVVLRETAHPVTARSVPLKPGETRAFQLAFEHLPADWNQIPPTINSCYLSF